MTVEPYWLHSAKQLARLFERIPDLKLSDLGDDPQKFLASYVPPAGLWDKETEDLRQAFLHMEPRVFQTVYMTYQLELPSRSDSRDDASR